MSDSTLAVTLDASKITPHNPPPKPKDLHTVLQESLPGTTVIQTQGYSTPSST